MMIHDSEVLSTKVGNPLKGWISSDYLTLFMETLETIQIIGNNALRIL